MDNALLNDAASIFLILFVDRHTVTADSACIETYATAEFLELSGSGVRGHDDDGVLEVDKSAVAVGQSCLRRAPGAAG